MASNVIKNFDPSKQTDESFQKKTARKKVIQKNIKAVEKENPFDSADSIKPAESMFSPKIFPVKLIGGKHNYPFLKHITDNGEIFIRRFTMIEENEFKKLAESYTLKRFFEVISKVIETSVRSNIDVYKLSMVEQLYLFINIYSLTFDDSIEQETKCKDCDYTEKMEFKISKDIPVKYMSEKDFLLKEILLTSYDEPFKMWIKFPNLEEQLIYLDETVDWANKIKLLIDKIENNLENGYQVKKEDYLDIITNLNTTDKKIIRDFIEDTAQNYGALLEIKDKFICKNKSCKSFNKKQNVDLSLETFFEKIITNIM